ncbi:MAG: CopG family transcriptional regulator [Acidimicrobiia bacterium]|jgi:Arc/MetJ family transcription regulator
MRTTFTLDDDVAAAVERVRREEGLRLSEAVNRLIRRGLAAPARRTPYEHRSADVGLKVDVTDIGDVLDLLDES